MSKGCGTTAVYYHEFWSVAIVTVKLWW